MDLQYISESVLYIKNIVPYTPFLLRPTRKFGGLHPYVTDLPLTCTKRFDTSFMMRTVNKEWNARAAVFMFTMLE